jgi:hypothetical protein
LRDHNFGTGWADQAGKQAFQDIEDPAEDHVVTFMNLALFWYSQGSWRRSAIHKGGRWRPVFHRSAELTTLSGNAAQISHLLGLASEKPGVADTFELEGRRRRFWACYFMHCHAIEMGFSFGTGNDNLRVTLPWREDDYEAGLPSHPRVCLSSREGNGGIFCELAKALTFW